MANDAATIAQRAGEPLPDPQDGLFDQVIDNDLLSQALERRLVAKEAAKKAAKKAKEAHDQATGILAGIELEPDTVVRCGRFRIKLSALPGRSVAFETSESERLTISLLKDA